MTAVELVGWWLLVAALNADLVIARLRGRRTARIDTTPPTTPTRERAR